MQLFRQTDHSKEEEEESNLHRRHQGIEITAMMMGIKVRKLAPVGGGGIQMLSNRFL